MSDDLDKIPEADCDPVTSSAAENEKLPKAQDLGLEFHPIEIQGEPLSETIIRERR
jgi:hypothetical protein